MFADTSQLGPFKKQDPSPALLHRLLQAVENTESVEQSADRAATSAWQAPKAGNSVVERQPDPEGPRQLGRRPEEPQRPRPVQQPVDPGAHVTLPLQQARRDQPEREQNHFGARLLPRQPPCRKVSSH